MSSGRKNPHYGSSVSGYGGGYDRYSRPAYTPPVWGGDYPNNYPHNNYPHQQESYNYPHRQQQQQYQDYYNNGYGESYQNGYSTGDYYSYPKAGGYGGQRGGAADNTPYYGGQGGHYGGQQGGHYINDVVADAVANSFKQMRGPPQHAQGGYNGYNNNWSYDQGPPRRGLYPDRMGPGGFRGRGGPRGNLRPRGASKSTKKSNALTTLIKNHMKDKSSIEEELKDLPDLFEHLWEKHEEGGSDTDSDEYEDVKVEEDGEAAAAADDDHTADANTEKPDIAEGEESDSKREAPPKLWKVDPVLSDHWEQVLQQRPSLKAAKSAINQHARLRPELRHLAQPPPYPNDLPHLPKKPYIVRDQDLLQVQRGIRSALHIVYRLCAEFNVNPETPQAKLLDGALQALAFSNFHCQRSRAKLVTACLKDQEMRRFLLLTWKMDLKNVLGDDASPLVNDTVKKFRQVRSQSSTYPRQQIYRSIATFKRDPVKKKKTSKSPSKRKEEEKDASEAKPDGSETTD